MVAEKRRLLYSFLSREVAKRQVAACRCKGAGRGGHSSCETFLTGLVMQRLIFMSSRLNICTGMLCRPCLHRMIDDVSVSIALPMRFCMHLCMCTVHTMVHAKC